MPSSLKWYDSNVKRTLRLLKSEGETRVALLIRRQARRNISENDRIDTKFLHNSIYVATPETMTPIPADGEYLSRRTGKMVRRESGPIVQPADGAFVGAAAKHALFVELETPFLYPALTQVQGRQAEQAYVGKVGTGLFAPDDFEAGEE